jgi:putative oxidoreductase
MTTTQIQTAPAATRSRTMNRTLWTVQVVMSLFFVVGSAGPKLFGESYAVQTFHHIGAGTWFRYAIGIIELCGGIGLLIPRLAGLASLGLALLMVGAVTTQVTVLHAPVMATTPAVLAVVFAALAYARRAEIKALF